MLAKLNLQTLLLSFKTAINEYKAIYGICCSDGLCGRFRVGTAFGLRTRWMMTVIEEKIMLF